MSRRSLAVALCRLPRPPGFSFFNPQTAGNDFQSTTGSSLHSAVVAGHLSKSRHPLATERKPRTASVTVFATVMTATSCRRSSVPLTTSGWALGAGAPVPFSLGMDAGAAWHGTAAAAARSSCTAGCCKRNSTLTAAWSVSFSLRTESLTWSRLHSARPTPGDRM